MEGSAATGPAVAGAPAPAAPAPDAGQVPAAPQAPAAPVEPTPPVSPAAPEPTPAEPVVPEGDLQSRYDQMEQRALAAEAQLAGAAPEEAPDFLTALQGAERELGISPEDLAALQAGQEPEQVSPEQQEAQLSELDAYVNERIQEALSPLQEARQHDQVRAWQEKNADVVPGTPLGDGVLETMQGLAERYGEQVVYDPHMLDLATTQVRAKMADQGAVPAGQAAQHGASIETQAGQTQTGEASVEDQYVNALTKDSGTPSHFD